MLPWGLCNVRLFTSGLLLHEREINFLWFKLLIFWIFCYNVSEPNSKLTQPETYPKIE